MPPHSLLTVFECSGLIDASSLTNNDHVDAYIWILSSDLIKSKFLEVF